MIPGADSLAEMWRAMFGRPPPEPGPPPKKQVAPIIPAYHCTDCGVLGRQEGDTLRCWCCGRFVKSNVYGIGPTNGATGQTWASMTGGAPA